MGARTKTGFKVIRLLAISVVFSLCILGVAYGNWNNHAQVDLTFNMGDFEPEVKANKVTRSWIIQTIFGAFGWEKDFTVNKTAINDKLTINIGESGNNDVPEPGVPGDRYKIFFTLKNNSTIPINYKVIRIPSVPSAAIRIGCEDTWHTLLPGESEENWASIKVSHCYFSFGLNSFNKDFAKLKVRQFNYLDDSGWKKDIDIGVNINEFVPARL